MHSLRSIIDKSQPTQSNRSWG